MFVDAVLGGLASESDRDVVAALQDRVRDRSPDATTLAQDELASLTPGLDVVYVYRAGHRVNGSR